jgi:alcohol dehydrogenase
MQEFAAPPKIVTGDGCAGTLGEEAAAFGAKRALIVTDTILAEKTGSVKQARSSLESAGLTVEVFADVEPDPLIATAVRSAKFARPFWPEIVIGLGGGSPIDVAKATSVILGNETPLSEMWGVRNVPRPGPPLILLPTTAGTGSEVTPNSILTDEKPDGTHMKKGIVSPFIIARVAIVDPLLSLTAPPGVTASTGMDALTHAVESYVSVNAQPLTDPLALEAIRLVGRSLRRAVAHGSDLEARRDMANASLMAGLAFANGFLGAVHAIAMAVGGRHNVAHGIANGLLLPYVMEFNEMGATRKYAAIAAALGEPIGGLSEREAAHRASLAVYRLVADLGLPQNLAEIAVDREAIPALAEEAFRNQRLLKNNPRGATAKDIAGILERVASGPPC